MNRVSYIVLMLFFLTAGHLAGQEPVIDRVCRGTSFHYRVDGEAGSTYIWELTHPNGTIEQLISDADTILIHWNYPSGIYKLEVMQFNDEYECDAIPMHGYVIILDLPQLSLHDFGTYCEYLSGFELSGGLPGGGTYTGTGVTDNMFDPTVAGPGTHTITYTYSDADGCTSFVMANITVAPRPTVVLEDFGHVCLDMEPFALTGGLPEGGNYSGSGIEHGLFDPAMAGTGTHTITYTFTDQNGCVSYAVGTIIVEPLPLVTLEEFDNICLDMEPFALTGGLPEGGNYSGPGIDDGVFYPAIAGPGTHTIAFVYVTTYGCEAKATATLEVLDQPVIGCPPDLALPENDEPILLSGELPEGGTFSGTGLTDNLFDPSAAGPGKHPITYHYTDENGCSASCIFIIEVTIPVEALIAVAAVDNHLRCFESNDGQASASASGGIEPYSFLWDDPMQQDTPTATGLAAGSYSVIVTDSQGWTATATVVITQPDALDVVAEGSDPTVHGGNDGTATAIVSGGTPPYTYLWSNGHSEQSLTGLTSGTFTVTVADANGCTASAQVSLSEPPPPADDLLATAEVDNHLRCFESNDGQASASASGGIEPYSFLWDDPMQQDTPTATGLAAGSYSVIVTDSQGWTATATVVITQPDALDAVAEGSDPTVHGGNDGTATATVSGGTPPYTYLWDDPDAQTTATAINLFAGTYQVTITDYNGCTAQATVTLDDPVADLHVTAIVENHISCKGSNDGRASAMVTGGLPPYTYRWDDSNNQATQLAERLSAGNYTVIVSDSEGRTAYASIAITEPSQLEATTQFTDPTTPGGNDGTARASVSGGTPPYSYRWSGPVTRFGANATNLIAGTYHLRITDARGCELLKTVTLTDPIPDLEVEAEPITNVSCFGGSDGEAMAVASGGVPPYTFRWNDRNRQTTARATRLQAGNYIVTVTDSRGKTATAQITIEQPSQIVLTLTSTETSRPGRIDGSATVEAEGGTPPYTYLWSDQNNQRSSTARHLRAGSYTVTVTDSNSCVVTGTVVVSDPKADLRIIKLGNHSLIDAGDEIRYSLRVFNDGPSVAYDLKVVDILPENTDFVSCNANGYYNPNTHTVEWDIPSLQVGSMQVFLITVRSHSNLLARTTITNTARLISAYTPAPLEDFMISMIRSRPNMKLTKTALDSTYSRSGERIEYRIQVENTGNIELTNIQITDPNATITSGSPIQRLAPGQTAMVEAVHIVTQHDIDHGSHSNVASASARDIAGSHIQRHSNEVIVYAMQLPEISIEKQAIEEHYSVVGDLIHYTFTVYNTGNVTLTDIQVSDPGVVFEGTTSAVERLAPGKTAQLTARYTVTQEDLIRGEYVNMASVEAKAPGASTIEALSNEVTVPAIFNEIVANDDHSEFEVIGLYGGISLESVLHNDLLKGTLVLPEEIILTQLSGLEQGISIESSARVVVEPNTPGGQYQISYQICERLNVVNCDQATVTIDLQKASDISVMKEVIGSIVAGEPATYRIRAENHGPEEAEHIVITDIMDQAFTQCQYSVDQGINWEPWTGTYSPGQGTLILSPGESYTILLTGLVSSHITGSISNTVTVSSTTYDPLPENNSYTIITPVETLADLSVIKTTRSDTLIAGEMITYEIQAMNHGPSDAREVRITDELPNVLYAGEYSTDGGASWHPWDGTLIPDNSSGILRAGEGFSFLIRAMSRSDAYGEIHNTARIEAQTSDPDHSNNSSTASTVIKTLSDLSIRKTASHDPVIAGDSVIYSIKVSNHGPSDARMVTVTDVFSESFSGVSYRIDEDQPWQQWNGYYTIENRGGVIDAGESFSFELKAKINSNVTGLVENTATVASMTPDPDMTNNTSTAISNVLTLADLSVVKSADRDTVVAGEMIYYTIRVENAGPSDARNVVINDQLPEGLEHGEYRLGEESTWHTWDGVLYPDTTHSTLKAGEYLIVSLRARVKSNQTGLIINTVYVASDTDDPDTSNNSSTATTEIRVVADLQISKSASADPVIAGETITYTITVHNAGPSDASDVFVVDSLASELLMGEFSDGDHLQWEEWTGTIHPFAEGIFAAGESYTFMIRAMVRSDANGYIQNRAHIQSSTYDPVVGNNSATVITRIESRADLEIKKISTHPVVVAGDSITYIIEVINHGPSDALEVVVYDELVEQLHHGMFASDESTEWLPWSGRLPIGTNSLTMSAGSSYRFMIRALVDQFATGSLSNVATVDSQTEDPVSENNTASVDTEIKGLADLAIDMLDFPQGDMAYAGASLDYGIWVINHGPSAAHHAWTVVELPEQLTFSSCEGQCTYNAGSHTVSYHLGDMARGDSLYVMLSTMIDPGVDNGVEIITNAHTGSDTEDPNLNNNTTMVLTPVKTLADLAIQYMNIVPTSSPNAGTQIAYTITVENLGPSHARHVSVATELPNNLYYVRSNRGITQTEKQLSWALGDLRAGETEEIILVVNIPSYVFENTIIASIVDVYSHTEDPELDNNTDKAVIDIRGEADLKIHKYIDQEIATVSGGDLITYYISVTNDGPSFAYDVWIVDELPEGLSFVSADDNGYYDNYYHTVTWRLPYLADRSTVERKVTVRVGREVPHGTILANNANTISATHDPDFSNNVWVVGVPVEKPPELFIPEGFSPDGDGINDYFIIGGLQDYYPNNKILIIDRWGKKVHEASPYHENWWDGTDLNCNPLPIGTYYYILELGGSNETIRGFIYLMRPY